MSTVPGNTADVLSMPPAEDTRDLHAKRQKVTTACDQCRTKKIKCNGIQPRCGPCSTKRKKNGECTWLHATSRTSAQASREHIQLLERQIQELKSTTPNYLESRDEDAQVCHGEVSPVTQKGMASPDVGRFAEASQGLPLPSSAFTSGASIGFNESVTSAMLGSTGTINEASGFYGSSSFGKFIGQVRRAVDQKMGYNGPSPRQGLMASTRTPSTAAAESDYQHEPLDYALPSRKRADALLAMYWQVVQPLYPFLDKSDTLSAYESLWTGQNNSSDETDFYCVINTIFALSSQLNITISPAERQSSASLFFQRTKRSIDLWKPTTLQTIQLYLLIAQYLQSTDDPQQCWIFVGLAVRAAQGLGIHLSETIRGITSPRKRELSLRIWHGCVLMDRFIAMTHGRPMIINRSLPGNRDLPVAVDDEYLPDQSGTFGQPVGVPSKLEFFIESLKLYEIMADILSGLYSHDKDDLSGKGCKNYFGIINSQTGTPSILEVDNKLIYWERNLPSHLKDFRNVMQDETLSVSVDKPIFFRQALILRQRFLHVRLLSLRPILSNFVGTELDDSSGLQSFGTLLQHRLAHQCSVVCVKVAQEAIEIVQTFRDTEWASTGSLAAWWYSTFYVYSAATVLIAARLKSSIMSEIGHESLLQTWNSAMEVLQSYSSFSSSIPKLLVTLKMLFEEVPVLYSHHNRRHTSIDWRSPSPRTHSNRVLDPEAYHTEAPHIIGSTNLTTEMDDFGISLPPGAHFDLAEESSTNDEVLMHLRNLPFDPNDFSWLHDVPYSWHWDGSNRNF